MHDYRDAVVRRVGIERCVEGRLRLAEAAVAMPWIRQILLCSVGRPNLKPMPGQKTSLGIAKKSSLHLAFGTGVSTLSLLRLKGPISHTLTGHVYAYSITHPSLTPWLIRLKNENVKKPITSNMMETGVLSKTDPHSSLWLIQHCVLFHRCRALHWSLQMTHPRP